jgi:integrative and conjugative element protein (TIGR02256 family)
MDALRYELGRGRQVVISGETVEELLTFRQTGNESEAGGLLVGMYLKEGDHLYIDRLTTPQRCDRRSRFGFFRSLMHNVRLQRIWRESEETRVFVGSWHTHPEPDPTPSAIDLKDWGRLLAKGSFVGDELFFIIVGTKRIRAWKGARGATVVNELELMGDYKWI